MNALSKPSCRDFGEGVLDCSRNGRYTHHSGKDSTETKDFRLDENIFYFLRRQPEKIK